jgi:hypothetical protein
MQCSAVSYKGEEGMGLRSDWGRNDKVILSLRFNCTIWVVYQKKKSY